MTKKSELFRPGDIVVGRIVGVAEDGLTLEIGALDAQIRVIDLPDLDARGPFQVGDRVAVVIVHVGDEASEATLWLAEPSLGVS